MPFSPIDIHKKVTFSREEFEDIKRLGQFSLNVYSASWALMGDPKDAAYKMGLTDQDQVVFTWFKDKEGDDPCPKFMIFIDETSKSVVLAIRGTFSLTGMYCYCSKN